MTVITYTQDSKTSEEQKSFEIYGLKSDKSKSIKNYIYQNF